MKSLLKKFFFLTFSIFFLIFNSNAAHYVSAGSGSWDLAETWNIEGFPATVPPGENDEVYIGSDHIVTINSKVNCGSFYLMSGSCVISESGNLNIANDAIINSDLINSGSINCSNSLTINPGNSIGSISGQGNVTVGLNLNVNGIYDINGITNLKGDLIQNYNGSFYCENGTVIFSNPSIDQSINVGTIDFNKLIVQKEKGQLRGDGNNISVKSLTLNGILSISEGSLTLKEGFSIDGAPYSSANFIKVHSGSGLVNVRGTDASNFSGKLIPIGLDNGAYTPFIFTNFEALPIIDQSIEIGLSPSYNENATSFNFVKSNITINATGIESVYDFQFEYGFSQSDLVGLPSTVSVGETKINQGFVGLNSFGVNKPENTIINGNWFAGELITSKSYFAVNNGDWNNQETWEDSEGQNGIPNKFDQASISKNVEVLVNSDVACSELIFNEFEGQSKLTIQSGSLNISSNLSISYPEISANFSPQISIDKGAELNVGGNLTSFSEKGIILINGLLKANQYLSNYGNISGTGDVFIDGSLNNGPSQLSRLNEQMVGAQAIFDVNGTITITGNLNNGAKFLCNSATVIFSNADVNQRIYGVQSFNEVKNIQGK